MTRFTKLALGAVVAACAVMPVAAASQQAPAGTTSTAAPLPSSADSALDARTTAVASQLRCPVCQGESIQDSPSELAHEMRELVKSQLAEGKTPAEVKAYFVSKYGEWILLDPKAHGFNLVLYAAPYLLLVAGFGVIVVAVKKWTRGSGERAEPQNGAGQ
jgi:cytochrome c-type biogenesis protein CcmH/NrfF